MENKVLLCLSVFILLTSLGLGFCQNQELPKERIIEIATLEYKTISNATMENRTIIYDEGNKNYQAVCFIFTPPANETWFGGDAWFFIDKITGKVLTNHIEK